jgi:2'-5' RNA ligase
MKKMVQTMPGYRVNEYLLLLRPPEELWNRVQKVKEEFAQNYKVQQASWTKPHITLVRFDQLEIVEERIVSRLKLVAMGYHPFKVEFKDFGSYPSHTIFINMLSREPVRALVREIRGAQRLMKLDDENKPHFIDEPNLTIARKLLPWQYEKGWQEYSNRHFTGRFIADSMLLLKRKSGEKKYQIAQRFEFMNLPVATKQGELFAY